MFIAIGEANQRKTSLQQLHIFRSTKNFPRPMAVLPGPRCLAFGSITRVCSQIRTSRQVHKTGTPAVCYGSETDDSPIAGQAQCTTLTAVARAEICLRSGDIMTPSSKEPPRALQRMLSGRRLNLLDPSPLDIEVEDIAHGLARVARWNGQTTGPHAFSVAQHCVIVESIVVELAPRSGRQTRLMALLHDAPEYVIGDLISPFKAAVGIDYKDFELKLLAAIHVRFGLPARAPRALLTLFKRADRFAGFYEATQLAGFSTSEAKRFFGSPPKAVREPKLVPLAPAEAQTCFLERFRRLAA